MQPPSPAACCPLQPSSLHVNGCAETVDYLQEADFFRTQWLVEIGVVQTSSLEGVNIGLPKGFWSGSDSNSGPEGFAVPGRCRGHALRDGGGGPSAHRC